MYCVSNPNTYNEQGVADVIIEEIFQVEVSGPHIYISGETENVDASDLEISSQLYASVTGNCVPEETVNADTSVPKEMFIEGGANVYVLDTEDTFNGEEISIQYPDSDSISNCESYLYI